MNRIPFSRSYWVAPGKLLAGYFPGDKNPDIETQKLGGLLDCGIRHIVNLMEENEVDYGGLPFHTYHITIKQLAARRGVEIVCERFPIQDLGIPSRRDMRLILDTIDKSIDQATPVYVHCWGGKGRTGTVVGCWLARHEIAQGSAILEKIRGLRRFDPNAHQSSPETTSQRDMVLSWKARE